MRMRPSTFTVVLAISVVSWLFLGIAMLMGMLPVEPWIWLAACLFSVTLYLFFAVDIATRKEH